MASVVSIKTQKGGEGKTTLAVNLAAFLAANGYRVLVVDMDAQGHFSLSLAMTDQRGKPVEGIFNVIVNGKSISDYLFPVPEDEYTGVAVRDGGLIHLLPGGIDTALAAIKAQLLGADVQIFQRMIINPVTADYDVILIDNEPTAGLWLGAILHASDYILIPSQMAVLSLDGAKQIVLQMANLAGLHKAKVLGLVPMMTHARTKEYRQQVDIANQMLPGKVWQDVGLPYSTIWKEASNFARGIFSYAPKHAAAKRMWRLGERVMKELSL